MTLPRRVLLKSSYLVSRRCEQRCRFLNPCLDINQLVLFCYGYAAQREHVDIHSLVGMGNHAHNTVTDPEARLPDFCHWAHTMIARAANSWMGRFGCLWDGTRSYNACLLGVAGEVDPLEYSDELLSKMVYCALNPVRAGLVKHAVDWPGINSVKWHIGEPITIERPRFFFRPDGDVPASVTFSFSKPPGFEDLDDAAFDRLFRERVRDGELEIRREFKAAGRDFAGPETILKQERRQPPRTKSPRWRLNPHVACKNKDRRIAMLLALIRFRAEYARAREMWLAGDDDVLFPAGTFQLRHQSTARCRGPDPAAA